MKLPVTSCAESAVVDRVLVERLPDPLRDAAMLLAVDDHRVEHLTQIVDHHVAVDPHLAGFRIDLEFDRMRAVRMARRLGRMRAGPPARCRTW
jgi:hypothetical protein